MRRGVRRRRVRLGMRRLVCSERRRSRLRLGGMQEHLRVGVQLQRFEGIGGHIKQIHGLRNIDKGVRIVFQTELFSLGVVMLVEVDCKYLEMIYLMVQVRLDEEIGT